MPQTIEFFYDRLTPLDIQLAAAYYPILIDMAKHKRCVTYGELVEMAKALYSDRPGIRNAIAISTGRRLDVVRFFTQQRKCPDLTSLVINKGTGECGTGFIEKFDPIAARALVFDFDWSKVTIDFDLFVKDTEIAITPLKKVKEAEALKLMSEYYQAHKETLPKNISHYRESIVRNLMNGFPPKDSFEAAVSGTLLSDA